ncbi:NADH dehydrogenase [Nitrosomonas cryotolerans]|uniref:NADH dehydrogenase n=1 Tax=Nitrosomonas cryotolerans ATCC 49181 TaxID=1131553 RepID=A0A1N6IQ70_9PROT|nr:FAD-dependent oxidoreductase [Nitrosomonas cryotolerans]SFP34707.1 NADH dehydrogenase [Nitrosomonas cryotolerans]SIO34172.1 NADH dehydrogenase [Nitrosomonas cryotolerans ATCC 49181]
MAFLPFYIPRHKRLKIVIIGGGYAGIAAFTTLLHYAQHIDITIVDPKDQHIKITHLHETFRYPLSDVMVPYTDLVARFGCRYIRSKLILKEHIFQQWQNNKCIFLDDEVLPFDYLLIASGCEKQELGQSENILNLQDFMVAAGSDLLTSHIVKHDKSELFISVVGGGATGIQFLFEIKQFLRRHKITNKLRLINSGSQVLEQFPKGFDSYVQSRMRDLNIDFYPNTYYCEQQADKILLKDKLTEKQFNLPSSLSLLFLGKKTEKLFNANAFGQVIVDEKTLPNIFIAGDCSYYHSLGSNTLTAQSAVRKGKLAARNILHHSSILKLLEPYIHRELGYVVSLGSTDAVGWLVSEGNVVTGIPALAIKELVEAQYDLLLMGIDTYLV